jgi:hypothetical protein
MTAAGWLTSPNMHKSRRRGPSLDARTATDGCQHVGRWDCFAHESSPQASCMGTPGGHVRKLHRSTKHSSCAAAAASRPCTVLHIHTNTVSRGTKRHIRQSRLAWLCKLDSQPDNPKAAHRYLPQGPLTSKTTRASCGAQAGTLTCDHHPTHSGKHSHTPCMGIKQANNAPREPYAAVTTTTGCSLQLVGQQQ